MPFCFHRNYGSRVVSIIDCFDLFIEKPAKLFAISCTWSMYEHKTQQIPFSVTPQGSVSLILKGWGERTSDNYIKEHSGCLNNLLPGDTIRANRSFDVTNSVAIIGVSLNLPTFAKGRKQLTGFHLRGRGRHLPSLAGFHLEIFTRGAKLDTKIFWGATILCVKEYCIFRLWLFIGLNF